MLAREESVRFTYPAQQALISMALNQNVGALHAFTTAIARCIMYARVHYYKQPSRTFPDKSKCIRPVVKNGAREPMNKSLMSGLCRFLFCKKVWEMEGAVCISHFPNRVCGAKGGANAADDLFRVSLVIPGAELMLTPPAAPEPVVIDEHLVSESLNNYKGNFPKITAKREQSSEK